MKRFDDLIARYDSSARKVEMVSVDFRRMERRRNGVGISIALVLVSILLLLLWQVLSAPTSIGSPVSESEAIVRTNERLLEMVKWTVSTLLIGGAGIVGLNLYLGEARYNQDRALAEQQREDYRLQIESRMNIQFDLIEGVLNDFSDRIHDLEDPEGEAQEYFRDYATGEHTPVEEKAVEDHDPNIPQ